MNTTTITPRNAVTGSPVTKRAEKIAGVYVDVMEARARMESRLINGTPEDGDSFDALLAYNRELIRLGEQYDVYNWTYIWA